MAGIAHSLVRRAMDMSQSQPNGDNGDGPNEPPFKQIAFWGMAVMWFTVMIYVAVISAISYSYGHVVATLAMVESPTVDVVVTERSSMDKKEPLLSLEERVQDEDVLIVKTPPVTAKLRTAIRHLRSVAGPFARFRGLQIALVYQLLSELLTGVFDYLLGRRFHPLAAILAGILLCRIHMTWTHAMIAMPSSKHWWQRIPARKFVRRLVLPTAFWVGAQQLCLYVPRVLFAQAHQMISRPDLYGGQPENARKMALVQVFLSIFVFFATVILIVVPAEVSLKRVEASILPEGEEAIVSFDRSFDGKFVPEALGGTGAITLLDAWKTFGKEPRIRLLKLYVKVFAMQIAAALVFTGLLISELKMAMGGDFDRLVANARKSLKGEL